MNCKLCKGINIFNKFTIRNHKPSFDIFECRNCGFQFQDIPQSEAYRFYDEAYYSGKAAFSYLDERKMEGPSRIVWEARMKRLKKWDKTPVYDRAFLDVGCSFGGLLAVAKEAGYSPFGIEVSEYSGRFARERFGKDNIYIGNCETMSLPEDRFSVITMIEVIEHIYHPEKAIKNLYQSLKPGGIIMIQTADMAGLQALAGKENYHYYLPGHLSYFNRENLEKLLKQTGFREIKFIGGVEFGLLPKLLKSRATFKNIRDYYKWIRIAFYHYLSKISIGGLHFTSSMVMIARK